MDCHQMKSVISLVDSLVRSAHAPVQSSGPLLVLRCEKVFIRFAHCYRFFGHRRKAAVFRCRELIFLSLRNIQRPVTGVRCGDGSKNSKISPLIIFLCQWNLDSGFLELFSRFQSPEFRIPHAIVNYGQSKRKTLNLFLLLY